VTGKRPAANHQEERELIEPKRHPFAFLAVFVLLAGTAHSLPNRPSQQLLIASDVHFNPFADPTLVPELASAPVRKWEAILNRSKPAAYSPYGQDTNWWLLRSAFDAMLKTDPDPALVMITGDLLAHGFPQAYAKATHDTKPEHYRAFVSKTVSFITAELRQRYNKSQILLTPGNNDDECGDYDIEGGGPFLQDSARTARSLARANGQFTADWKSLGSFTVRPRSTPGVRIVSVNSVFFSNKYQAANFAESCAHVDSKAPTQTFAWLESTLSRAAQNHEKVWLMFHIPPGIDGYATMVSYRSLSQAADSPAASKDDLCSRAIVPMWKPYWTGLFQHLVAEYQATITAMFAGHDHTDDFRVLHGSKNDAQFVLINPPISPIYGQNPAFRVVTFAGGGQLVDQTTYYLTNLLTAQSDVPGVWTQEYSFVEKWHSPRLDAASLNTIYDQMRSDAEASTQWLTLLNVSSTHDHVPDNGVRTLECAIEALDPASYKACYCPVP
jgi:sphingomyelin phosphodiesterase acid-like 3